MRIRLPLFLIVLLATLTNTATVFAATVPTGSLVKIASQSDVYYVGLDNKRYVFPNDKTYFSWYTDFSGVTTVSDADLASLQIGGAVTVKPGSTLVKITTDPKVYAVDHDGVLRWIQTEAVATQIYGADWAKKVQDLPDAFFTTYTIGAPISVSTNFDPIQEIQTATSISHDKDLSAATSTPATTPGQTTSTPPTVPPSGSVTLTLSKQTAQAGDLVTLTAHASQPSGTVGIKLFFDGTLVQTCTISSCTVDTRIPGYGVKTSYVATAVATALDATTNSASATVAIQTDGSALVHISISRASITPGEVGEVVVDVDPSIAILTTAIYVGGVQEKICDGTTNECRWSDVLTGPIGKTYDVYSVVTDTVGRTNTSIHKTITLSTNDSPAVSIAAGKKLIYAGETVDVTVTASDNDGVASTQILNNGTVLKTCQGASPCTLITGPWSSTGTVTFVGQATDALGLSASTDPVTVNVTNP